MKSKVLKWPVAVGLTVLQLPAGSEILTLGAQCSSETECSLFIWTLSPVVKDLDCKTVRVVLTGIEFVSGMMDESNSFPVKSTRYIGTATFNDGTVFHAFEEKE